MSVAGDGTEDEPGITRANRLRIESAPLHRRQVALVDEKHICRGQQAMQYLCTERLIVVERKRTLIAIGSQKICGFAAHKRRTPATRLVSALPALDLDD